MATFTLVAVPLIKIERYPTGFIGREMEIMSSKTIRRAFEASTLAEVHQRLDEICAEIKQQGGSWHTWAVKAKGKAPRGFNAASDAHELTRDINPEAVTVGEAA